MRSQTLSAHIHARQSKEGSWPKHCDRLGGTCKNHPHSVYHPLSHTINQWSPTFLAPGLGFMEDGFSRDWGGVVGVACDGLGMIQGHCMYCALCFCYYYISSDSDHQALDPEAWGPLPERAAWIHVSSSLRWCFLKYLGTRGSLRGLRKSEGDGPRLVEDRCTPCAGSPLMLGSIAGALKPSLSEHCLWSSRLPPGALSVSLGE